MAAEIISIARNRNSQESLKGLSTGYSEIEIVEMSGMEDIDELKEKYEHYHYCYILPLYRYAKRILDSCVLHDKKVVSLPRLRNYLRESKFPVDIAKHTYSHMVKELYWVVDYLNEAKLVPENRHNLIIDEWASEDVEEVLRSLLKAIFKLYEFSWKDGGGPLSDSDIDDEIEMVFWDKGYLQTLIGQGERFISKPFV